ncbi:MAG: hypothetical protein A2017_17640 [Lentisphaerae bacterium GWF2_44_16]|nr:MAG: hypothetical protein A2017_17640 [Lentisphaerae bacterium GWF2_44_16]
MVIKGMTKVCRKVIIGIGSADKSGTKDNPYMAQERKEMIQQALQDEDIIPLFDVEFINLPDHPDDSVWAQQVFEQTKYIDMVWTGDPAVKKCFEGKVEIKEIREVPGISSTGIREMIRKGNLDWKTKVPASVVKAVQDLGIERI